MPQYNFDKVISRHDTYSAKWNNRDKSIIPLSVADMDIAVPDFMIQLLSQSVQQGVYGYTLLSDNWYDITANWFLRHYQWKVDPKHIVFCPRIIQAISLYIQNYTNVGDKITILSPGYSPISQSVVVNKRVLLESKLIYQNKQYSIDFDDLEKKLRESNCFILLSPHNPTGTIWTKDDLIKIASLAEKYQVFIISDDIHSDFIFSDQNYHVISSLNKFVEQNSFICTSPSKTFNMAGLEVANIVIANDKHRKKFEHSLIASGIHNPGYFSVPACITAYSQGDEWFLNLKEYLKQNRLWVINTCQQYFPQWHVTQSSGTYMLWVNYSEMNINEEQLKHWFINLANVEVSWGSHFGQIGHGFFRLNIATTKSLLHEAFERLIHSNPYRN